jgi:hypothetical protein
MFVTVSSVPFLITLVSARQAKSIGHIWSSTHHGYMIEAMAEAYGILVIISLSLVMGGH